MMRDLIDRAPEPLSTILLLLALPFAAPVLFWRYVLRGGRHGA